MYGVRNVLTPYNSRLATPSKHGPRSGSPALVLFPTELERQRFADRGGLPLGLAVQKICGFGPVAAAARTAQLLEKLKPARVVLCGIAGTFNDSTYPVGSAAVFGEVAIDGVGAGQGENHLLPPALGFPQWPGSEDTQVDPIELSLSLSIGRAAASGDAGPLLLTTCAASISEAEVRTRLERFPDAVAEDMEGFAVAMACALARIPLTIVRGFSNVVGDRDSRNWRIPSALFAAREKALAFLEQAS